MQRWKLLENDTLAKVIGLGRMATSGPDDSIFFGVGMASEKGRQNIQIRAHEVHTHMQSAEHLPNNTLLPSDLSSYL